VRSPRLTAALRLGEASASVALVRAWIAIVALLAALAVDEPAAAHSSGSAHRGVSIDAGSGRPPLVPAAEPAAGLPDPDTWAPAMLLLGVVGLATVYRRRRATALSTSLFMLVFVCGSAPHLVHHIFDPEQSRHCEILKSANHVEGATLAPDPPPPAPIARALAEVAPVPPAVEAPAAARGRAPPAA
jgi:hypothetical protein